ncbi:hypothetical protein C8J57DRAFT_1564709 [Mycena rebaudengoi]|nr:hypothetical protein C8J57DRAFT_1564709 [Mycena rebaudengoi]
MPRGGGKGKRKVSEDLQEQHIPFDNPAVKRVHFTTTSNSGIHQATTVQNRLPIVRTIPPAAATSGNSGTSQRNETVAGTPPPSPTSSALPKKPTQNSQLLDDYADNFQLLGDLLLEHEADVAIGETCSCTADPPRRRSVQCHDCTAYAATCEPCFVKAHLNNPFHWAEVWNDDGGFFVRHDISKLRHVIQLGHNGQPCPSPTAERLFTIVDHNGVHSTQESALHYLESKRSAYDFLGALLRLTDNSFTADVPSRVWNYLTLLKRCGQMHGIDELLPHRPTGNLLCWCPACPEAGLNSDPNCPETPPELRYGWEINKCHFLTSHIRHLNQCQRTLDGNHQCNQFNKNTDPDDVSLCAGMAYFPDDQEYKDYLKKNPVSREKSTCNYLKAVNKQDKKKFKNMAITGTVNLSISCTGEGFANSDCALAMAIRQKQPGKGLKFDLRFEVGDISNVSTYDIACEYMIHLKKRMKKNFPDVADVVAEMDWGVPALHVGGHQDDCTYLFGTSYIECIGHFHGETAEHYWPEANQLGPIVRQMNNGHRQDTLIYNHGDWNHKKTMKIAATLAGEIALAKTRYLEKRTHFIGLSITHKDRRASWMAMNRRVRKEGKEVISVYKHRASKIPSQLAIYKAMLAQDDNLASTMIPKTSVAHFLNDGLKIQDLQRGLQELIAQRTEHELVAVQKEIDGRSSKLQKLVTAFRQQQKRIMPSVADKVAAQAAASPAPPIEREKLFLPSDLTAVERMNLDLISLGIEESRWREGQAFDALRATQNLVKTVTALGDRKRKQERQQKQNTRAGDQISEIVRRRNVRMAGYEAARQAMISLGSLDASPDLRFPLLTETDLFMKSVRQKRHVGDSQRTDGRLFQAPVGGLEVPVASTSSPVDISTSTSGAGTQMDKRKSGPRVKKSSTPSTLPPKKDDKPERTDGWLWNLGKMAKMTDEEMTEWTEEGDRVQWFRAEADVQRWQEQGEQKLAELLRTVRSFKKMSAVWKQLAEMQSADQPGAKAYARQKAAMYQRRMEEAEQFVVGAGYKELLGNDANLIRFVREQRAKEAQIFADAVASAPEDLILD